MNRESQILAAMPYATPAEQNRLVAELDQIRASASAESSIDRLIRERQTPASTFVPHTAATNWIARAADVTGSDSQVHTSARAVATGWFRSISPDVRSDHEEFMIQAVGASRYQASAHGELAHVAHSAFMQQVRHLAGGMFPGSQDTVVYNDAGEPLGWDAPYDGPSDATEGYNDEADMYRESARRECVYSAETNHSSDIMEIYHGSTTPTYVCGYHEQRWGVPGTGRYEAETGKTASRRVMASTCSDCGAPIERDPEGEENRSWHHNDGSTHDHEAKPSGDSKESSRRNAGFGAQGSQRTAAPATGYERGRAPGTEWTATCTVCGGTETGTDYYNGWPSQDAWHNHLFCGHDPSGNYDQNLAIDRHSSLRTNSVIASGAYSYMVFSPALGRTETASGFSSIQEASAAAEAEFGNDLAASGFINDPGGNAYAWSPSGYDMTQDEGFMARGSRRVMAAADDSPGSICPYCDFHGSKTEVANHLFEEGADHKKDGTVTDQMNAKGGSRRTASKAYNKGLQDGRIGDGIQYNPYPFDSSDASEWIRGYREAQGFQPGEKADAKEGSRRTAGFYVVSPDAGVVDGPFDTREEAQAALEAGSFPEQEMWVEESDELDKEGSRRTAGFYVVSPDAGVVDGPFDTREEAQAALEAGSFPEQEMWVEESDELDKEGSRRTASGKCPECGEPLDDSAIDTPSAGFPSDGSSRCYNCGWHGKVASRRTANAAFGPDAQTQSGHGESALPDVTVSDTESLVNTNLGWITDADVSGPTPTEMVTTASIRSLAERVSPTWTFDVVQSAGKYVLTIRDSDSLVADFSANTREELREFCQKILDATSGTTAALKTSSLNDQMEMDHPVEVKADGSVVDAPSGVYGPSVHAYEGMGDDPEIDDPGWEFFSRGYTGQSGVKRSDPIMHASEYIGGRMEQDILENPGIYVATTVEDMDDPESPWGWVVLRKKGSATASRRTAAFGRDEEGGDTPDCSKCGKTLAQDEVDKGGFGDVCSECRKGGEDKTASRRTASNYYLDMHEDADGNLVDIDYYHNFCAPDSVKEKGGWPAPEFPDYDVYCAGCGELINAGISQEGARRSAAKLPFDQWMAKVDEACLAKSGLSIHDLEDQPFSDWHADGISPGTAARMALRYSMEGSRKTSALFYYDDHADNPPSSWVVVKAAEGVWQLQTKDGGVLDSFPTKTKAEEAKSGGFLFDLYEQEKTWYGGGEVNGWKPFDQSVIDEQRRVRGSRKVADAPFSGDPDGNKPAGAAEQVPTLGIDDSPMFDPGEIEGAWDMTTSNTVEITSSISDSLDF